MAPSQPRRALVTRWLFGEPSSPPLRPANLYKCALCGTQSLPRVPQQTLIVETRFVAYPRRKDVFRRYNESKKKFDSCDDPGGDGPQIARELKVCALCAH